MSLDFIKMFSSLFLSQIIVFSGILFMAGQLLPQTLAGFYTGASLMVRGVAAMFVFFAPANFLMSYIYKVFNPAMVTPTGFFIVVLVQVIMTALVVGSRLTLMMVPAMAVTIAGCLWVYSLLIQKL